LPDETPEVAQASAVPKIKTRKPKQRACDEHNEKGKLCAGHLKRWYDLTPEVAAIVGRARKSIAASSAKSCFGPTRSSSPTVTPYVFKQCRETLHP
jgi:hypothetical protein